MNDDACRASLSSYWRRLHRPARGRRGDDRRRANDPTRRRSAPAAWTEVKWPFPLDQWGTGRAFQCAAADCGAEIRLYLRPKLGFCNCTTGVADDAELDRVGDLELLSDKFEGLSDGRPITVGWMKGRSRPYQVAVPYALAAHRACHRLQRQMRRGGRDRRRRARPHRRPPSAPRSSSSTAISCCAGSSGSSASDEIRRHRLSRHQSRARHGARAETDLRPRAGHGLARRHRVARGHRSRGGAGRLLLRRLSALRRDRGARADHGRGARACRQGRAGARRLQRLPDSRARPGCCPAC